MCWEHIKLMRMTRRSQFQKLVVGSTPQEIVPRDANRIALIICPQFVFSAMGVGQKSRSSPIIEVHAQDACVRAR